MNKYGLIGHLVAKEGEGQELGKLLLKAAELLKKNADCHQYIVAVEKLNPDRIWVTEIWSSKDAHDKSLQLESVREIIQRAMPLIVQAPDLGVETKPMGGVAKPLGFQ